MKGFLKMSLETKVFLLFFSMLLLFTLGRGPIGALNAALLSLTNEMPSPMENDGIGISSYNGGSAAARRKSTRRRKKIPDKPTTTKLPKTKIPVVAWCDTLSVSAAHAPDLPSLRKYDGSKWNRNKTVMQAVTDGSRLRLQLHLFDSKPNEAITENSRRDPSLAWMDDGVELFLMKDRNAGFYCHYVASVIGRGTIFYKKCNKDNLAGGSNATTPSDFILPLITAHRTSDGFVIKITANLSNIGIGSLEPGDTFLIQIIRNFRGQRQKGSVILQLFPTHIYADNRRGANNHHRKAFSPVRIVDSKEFGKQ